VAEATRSFSVPGIIQGCHMFQRMWTPRVGEKVMAVSEMWNEQQLYALLTPSPCFI